MEKYYINSFDEFLEYSKAIEKLFLTSKEDTPNSYPCVLATYQDGMFNFGLFIYEKDLLTEINITDENYVGYDEDYNGNWNDFYTCPKCLENNYVGINDPVCHCCGVQLKWCLKKGGQ